MLTRVSIDHWSMPGFVKTKNRLTWDLVGRQGEDKELICHAKPRCRIHMVQHFLFVYSCVCWFTHLYVFVTHMFVCLLMCLLVYSFVWLIYTSFFYLSVQAYLFLPENKTKRCENQNKFAVCLSSHWTSCCKSQTENVVQTCSVPPPPPSMT